MTLKKALVTITVVAMLFGMVGTAFAGFSDISDSNVAAAAARLGALNIMQGFPDGSFGASASITRAQFAAVAVRALGLDTAATYAKGFTKFSDVGADHWASGYVNIASQQGIIAGFPDGTFHPEESVTYAQALTIIVRMLGYGPVTEGVGTWPSNYIVRASLIGFTNGISFAAMSPATRGDVALFVDGSLSKDMMVNTGAVGSTPTYAVQPGTTILGTYLGATKTTGLLTSNSELLGVKTVAINGGAALTLADGVSAIGLLGQSVNVWSKSGKVVLVQGTGDTLVSGFIATAGYTAPVATVSDGSIKIGTKTYVINDDAKIFTSGVAGGTPVATDEVRIALDADGNAKSVVATHYTTGVVTSVDVDGKLIVTSAGTLNFGGTQTSSLTKDGATIAIADVKEDDVVMFYGTIAKDGNKVVVVTRNAVTGKLTTVYTDGTAKIGDKVYAASNPAVDFAASIDSDVTVLLDKNGKVWDLSVVTPASATEIYAIATTAARTVNTSAGTQYFFTAKKADNSTVYLQLKDNTLTPVADTLYTYTVDEDGIVQTLTAVDISGAGARALNTTDKTVGGLFVTSSTLIADVENGKFITSADLFKLASPVTGEAVADASGYRAELVVLTASTPAVATVDYALVTNVFQDVDGWHAIALSGGSTTTIDLAASLTIDTVAAQAPTDLVVGDLYEIVSYASGKVDNVNTAADINYLVGSFDHNVVISYDSTYSILTYKAVDVDGVKLGSTLYDRFSEEVAFIDNSGDAPVFSTVAVVSAGRTVSLFDIDADGLVDVVIAQ